MTDDLEPTAATYTCDICDEKRAETCVTMLGDRTTILYCFQCLVSQIMGMAATVEKG